jgi:hypothetical protein
VKHRFSDIPGIPYVAKSDLGTKRICPTTGKKFYDLQREFQRRSFRRAAGVRYLTSLKSQLIGSVTVGDLLLAVAPTPRLASGTRSGSKTRCPRAIFEDGVPEGGVAAAPESRDVAESKCGG